MSEIDAAFHGTLGKDAEPKVSNAGNPYVRLSVRVGSGDSAQWVSVLAFSDLDDIGALEKGDKVYCEGTLTATAWIDQKSGEARPSLTMMAARVIPTHAIGRRRERRQAARQSTGVEA
jgi:Single-strand binding protein family